ncbi:MAG: YbfB/YjiJ family MFS transporter, partial [Campylobacter sp.]|nr:YbfB/YjiJ family MFS transporter [Campylobacter sp.]
VSKYHLDYAWVLLGCIALFAFIWSLFTLKTLNPAQKKQSENKKFKISYFLWLLVISYSLNAIAYLPHTLFWVDFLVRDLNFDIVLAGASWAFFGIGAAFGSLGSGILGDKIGFKNAHIIILLLKALSCLIAGFYFIFPQDFLLSALNVSVFLMGFTTTGNVVLTNAMALEIVGKEYFSQSSSFLTLAFGLFQALFSFAFTYSLNWTDYATLFNICVILHILSALVLLPIKKLS